MRFACMMERLKSMILRVNSRLSGLKTTTKLSGLISIWATTSRRWRKLIPSMSCLQRNKAWLFKQHLVFSISLTGTKQGSWRYSPSDAPTGHKPVDQSRMKCLISGRGEWRLPCCSRHRYTSSSCLLDFSTTFRTKRWPVLDLMK